MSLKSVCECCGGSTAVSYESGRRYEQCADKECGTIWLDNEPLYTADRDAETRIALGLHNGPGEFGGGPAVQPSIADLVKAFSASGLSPDQIASILSKLGYANPAPAAAAAKPAA